MIKVTEWACGDGGYFDLTGWTYVDSFIKSDSDAFLKSAQIAACAVNCGCNEVIFVQDSSPSNKHLVDAYAR